MVKQNRGPRLERADSVTSVFSHFGIFFGFSAKNWSGLFLRPKVPELKFLSSSRRSFSFFIRKIWMKSSFLIFFSLNRLP
jgi:hypothetical protein